MLAYDYVLLNYWFVFLLLLLKLKDARKGTPEIVPHQPKEIILYCLYYP